MEFSHHKTTYANFFKKCPKHKFRDFYYICMWPHCPMLLSWNFLIKRQGFNHQNGMGFLQAFDATTSRSCGHPTSIRKEPTGQISFLVFPLLILHQSYFFLSLVLLTLYIVATHLGSNEPQTFAEPDPNGT